MTLDEMIDIAGKHAREVLVNMGIKRLMTTVCYLDGKGDMVVAGLPEGWNNDTEKQLALAMMKSNLQAAGATMY
jgi:hypothetical protein